VIRQTRLRSDCRNSVKARDMAPDPVNDVLCYDTVERAFRNDRRGAALQSDRAPSPLSPPGAVSAAEPDARGDRPDAAIYRLAAHPRRPRIDDDATAFAMAAVGCSRLLGGRPHRKIWS